jgi:hypothetical protein
MCSENLDVAIALWRKEPRNSTCLVNSRCAVRSKTAAIKTGASKRNGVMKQATLDRVFWITMMNRPIL